MERINVYVTNRKVDFVSDYPYEALIPFWSYTVPTFRFTAKFYPGWDGKIKLLKRDSLPAGLFWATYKDIEKSIKVKFRIGEDLVEPEFRKKRKHIKTDDPKYKFHDDCADRMVAAFRHGGGLVLNATSSGKTHIAAIFCSRIKGRILFVVDQIDLLEQAVKELSKWLGEEVGYVGNSKFIPKRVTVATVQTMFLHRKDKKFVSWKRKIVAMIIDEIHVQMSRRNFSVVENIRPKAVYGLTATLQLKRKPVRLKAFAICGPVLYDYPIVRGQKEGVLTHGIVVRVLYDNPTLVEKSRQTLPNPHRESTNALNTGYYAGTGGVRLHLDPRITKKLPSMQRRFSQYNEEYVSRIVRNGERNHFIESLVRRLIKNGKYIVLLVHRIKHVKIMSKRLEDIPHRLAYGAKGIVQRQRAIQKFEKGKIRLIIANVVFKKGINIKRIDAMIDAAGLKSENDAIQKYGRGLRLHPSKSGLLYYDISDHDPMEKDIKEFNSFVSKVNKYRKEKGLRGRIRKAKYTSFHSASVSRRRAFRKAGITVKDIEWDSPKMIYKLSSQWLKKELKRGKKQKA